MRLCRTEKTLQVNQQSHTYVSQYEMTPAYHLLYMQGDIQWNHIMSATNGLFLIVAYPRSRQRNR